MKNLFLSLCYFIFFLSYNLSAQNTVTNAPNENALIASGNLDDALTGRQLIESGRISEVGGSPFLFENWQPAYIFNSKGKKIEKLVSSKIDIFRNQIVMKNDLGKEIYLDPLKVSGIEIIDDKGVKRNLKRFSVKQNYLPYYCEVLFESPKIILVLNHVKVYKRADYVQRGVIATGSTYDRFESGDDYYYLKLTNKNFQRINLTRAEFIKQFEQEQQKKLIDFCKSNGISKRLNNSEAFLLCNFASAL